MPSKIFLPKGEKRQLVFWTDQDYTQLSTVSSVITSSTSQEPVDDFLEVVNGNKPSLSEVNNTNEAVESTTTTTTTTTTTSTTEKNIKEEIIFITTGKPELGVTIEVGETVTGGDGLASLDDIDTTTSEVTTATEATTISYSSTT